MAKKKKPHDRGMAWWRQGLDECLFEFGFREEMPKDKFAEALGVYIICKALVSKNYEEGNEQCCTIKVGIDMLIGITSLDKAELIAYLKRLEQAQKLNELVINEQTGKITITINRIYDEVDEYRRRLRGEKKAELSVVNGKGKPKKNANGFASDEEEQEYHDAQNMPKV